MSLFIYIGLFVALFGLLAVIRPPHFLKVRSRRVAGTILFVGVAVVAVGFAWPVRLQHPNGNQTRLDAFLPGYHFSEVHSRRIHAQPERTYRALTSVRPKEVRLMRALFGIRDLLGHLIGRSPEGFQEDKPLLDQLTGFVVLADEPGREFVVGTVMTLGADPDPLITTPFEFESFDRRGHVKAAMNFSITDEGGGWSRIRTETRVYAIDESTARKFAVYWRLIYPGSATLRRTLLDAVKQRAETAP